MNGWLILCCIFMGMMLQGAIDYVIDNLFDKKPKIKIKWEGKE